MGCIFSTMVPFLLAAKIESLTSVLIAINTEPAYPSKGFLVYK